MPGLKDIARRVGVSVSTVSKAINNATDISDETRERILQSAIEIGYKLNRFPAVTSGAGAGTGAGFGAGAGTGAGFGAESNGSDTGNAPGLHAAGVPGLHTNGVPGLHTNGMPNLHTIGMPNLHTIGIICPEIESNYYAQLFSTLEANISRDGHCVSVAFTNFQYQNEINALASFIRQNVSGIILITEGHGLNDDLQALKGSITCPLIVIAFDFKSAEYDNLLIDDAIGIKLAVDHLIELGHKDIGFISDMFTKDRLAYFKYAVSSRGLAVNDGNIYIEPEGRRFEACGYAGAAAILDGGAALTAVVAGYDDIAIGAMRLISERGLSVPGDISIVGIDNTSVTPFLPVSLTTVAAPVAEMADIATKILLRKLRDSNYKLVQQVFLRPRLIVRESTGKAAGSQ